MHYFTTSFYLTLYHVLPTPKRMNYLFLGQVKQVIDQYYRRLIELENSKYDLEKEVEMRNFQVKHKSALLL